MPEGVTPEDIFHYAYAVFHSPTYRTRYAEFLKIDFPRLPLTSNRDLFFSLAALGGELVGLHLMESPKLNDLITEFPEKGGDTVEKGAVHRQGQARLDQPDPVLRRRAGGSLELSTSAATKSARSGSRTARAAP